MIIQKTMVNRPLDNIRPLGPFVNIGDSETQSAKLAQPEDEELTQLKEDIEESIGMGVSISKQDAKAIYMLDTPMLQSYVSNVLGQASQHSDEVSVKSVIHSDATKKYARKVGSLDKLEDAKSVYD